MTKQILTQARLKELVEYDKDSGIFRWKERTSNRIKVGDVVGNVSPKLGYVDTKILGVRYYAHRLAWFYMMGEWPEEEIDHINHIRNDNRWCNLRSVSKAENGRNAAIKSNNVSGVTGVSWDKIIRKWQAFIMISGKGIKLGHYKNKDNAITARKEAELKYGFHPNHGR